MTPPHQTQSPTTPPRPAGLTPVAADPRTDPRWRVLAGGPGATLFTSPPWIRAVCATYGFSPQARVLIEGEQPVAGLTWVDLDDLRGPRRLSLPFSERADPIVGDRDTWNLLMSGLVDAHVEPDQAQSPGPWTLRTLLPSPAADDPRFTHTDRAAWHGTELPTDSDELWSQVHPAARRYVRTGPRRGVRVELRRDHAAMMEFHRLHTLLRKYKYRLLAQPAELFTNLWEEFRADDAAVVVGAYVGDELIAGALLLTWQDVVYLKFAASAPKFLHLHPNESVFWAALRHAHNQSAGWLDWGRSDLATPGLIAFKDKFATRRRDLITLRAGAAPASPAVTHAENTLGELTTLLTEPSVPDEITVRAGGLLYRYFC